MFIVFR